MDEIDREIRKGKRYRERLRALGTDNPSCAICGKTNPHVLSVFECDHVAGVAYDKDLTVILCRNCHAERSEQQRFDGEPEPDGLLAWGGRLLLGLIAFLELMIPHLRRLGEHLINMALRGDDPGLSFT